MRELFLARPLTLRPHESVLAAVALVGLVVVVWWRLRRSSMSIAANRCCSFCGEVFKTRDWPRRCRRCGCTSYSNPIPTAVVLLPIDGGLLVVKRQIPPAQGEFLLPGGYVNQGESWQAAAARELLEETGLAIDPTELTVFEVSSTSRGHMVTIYGLARPRRRDELPATFEPTAEVLELGLAYGPVKFVWDQDTCAVRKYFESRDHGVTSPEIRSFDRG